MIFDFSRDPRSSRPAFVPIRLGDFANALDSWSKKRQPITSRLRTVCTKFSVEQFVPPAHARIFYQLDDSHM